MPLRPFHCCRPHVPQSLRVVFPRKVVVAVMIAGNRFQLGALESPPPQIPTLHLDAHHDKVCFPEASETAYA